MIHGSSVAVNPLTELPGIGWVVTLMDEPLADARFPLWLAEAVELLAVGGLLFVLLKGVTRSFLPWALPAAVGPTVALLGALRVVLLLPQLPVTAAYDRAQRPPPRPVYAYGQGVMVLTDMFEAAARRVLPQCSGIRKVPDVILVVLLLALFALWNNNYCDPPAEPGCRSPVAEWVTQL